MGGITANPVTDLIVAIVGGVAVYYIVHWLGARREHRTRSSRYSQPVNERSNAMGCLVGILVFVGITVFLDWLGLSYIVSLPFGGVFALYTFVSFMV